MTPAPLRLPHPTYLVAVTSYALSDGDRNLQTMALAPLAPEDVRDMLAWLFEQPAAELNLHNTVEAVLVLSAPFDPEAFRALAEAGSDIDALPGFVGVLTPQARQVAAPAAEWN